MRRRARSSPAAGADRGGPGLRSGRRQCRPDRLLPHALRGRPAVRRFATRFARLDAIDQIGLVDDAWALGLAGTAADRRCARAGRARARRRRCPSSGASIAELLTKLDASIAATSGAPGALARLRDRAARAGARADGLGRARRRAGAATVLRAELIEALGELGDAATIAEAQRRLRAARERPDGVSGGAAQVDPGRSSRATPTPRPGRRCTPQPAPSRRRW